MKRSKALLARFGLRLGRGLPVAIVLAAALPALGQSSSAAPANQDQPEITTTTDLPEISSEEQSPSFQVKVNLVQLRVVVRDAKGKAVGSLKQDDFVLLDDKKPQTIARFTVERTEAPSGTTRAEGNQSAAPTPAEIRSSFVASSRIAYLVDDINSTPSNLVNAKKAIGQAIDGLGPDQPLGIFTLSGQGTQDFTTDKEKLRAAAAQLQQRVQGRVPTDCPPLNYYLADQIENGGNGPAFQMVVQQVIACQFDGKSSPGQLAMQEAAARAAIARVVHAGEYATNIALQTFNQVVQHVSLTQGPRRLIFLSPGFYAIRQQAAIADALDRAIRAGVMVSTLDLRGVFSTDPMGVDISQKAWGSAVYAPDMLRYQLASDGAQTDLLMEIAENTGGTFFHNNNDFSGGLAKLSAEPEVSYVLAFNPKDLKNDGKFHTLKVELKQPSGYSVQARKGYYAPKPGESGKEADREVAEAVFGHDEIHELPLQVQTQFFKKSDEAAQVSVLVRVDVRHMQFRKADGRNVNDLTVVAALFDRNANFVSGKNNTVRMHIKDDTLATKLNSGITLNNKFDIAPGTYLLRIVARDAQGKMTTQNDVIEIPE